MKQQIAEYPITEWEGIKVQMILSHPKFTHTLTSQTIFDRHMMDEIEHIVPPKNIDFLRMPERIFEYHEWVKKNERAHDLINYMAKNIANTLLRTLAEEINK